MKKNFIFGIYPGGAAGTDNLSGMATGKPDDPLQINKALDKLQSTSKNFLVRSYLHYKGNGEVKSLTPANPVQYLSNGRKLDLVLGYQPSTEDLKDWEIFIRNQIQQFGASLGKIQIAEEPNLHNIPYVDGDSPNVIGAVINGIIAAKEEILSLKLQIQTGFNGVPTFDPGNSFWREIQRLAPPEFYQSLDYVGLDFFPDVFREVPAGELKDAVTGVLNHCRNISLKEAGIPETVPIHITENGWATSPVRSPEKQAEVLEIIIRTVHELRAKMNISCYEMFDLRDADSENPDFFYQFGIMMDDYSPKPAFDVYMKLIAELGI
jgi:hypothetical protein